jgi:acetolactate synthase-1/2/3 large subunit
MKTARVVARTLKERGVKRVFGVPGGEVTDLMEGFRNEGIEFVLTRHEAAAAFMASATGTLTGIPGVCMATLGPGATNMVTGVAQAYLDRAPLIAFTGQLPRWRTPRDTHQVLDLQTLYAPITKWRFSLESKGCAAAIAKAVDVATAERPGPVYVEVPSDAGAKECEDGEPLPAGPGPARHLALECGQESIREAASLLAASKRPMLLAGLSASRAGATQELVALSEHAGVPVIVTPQGKSVFPEDHGRFVGVLEMLGTAYLFRLVASADFLVTVGLDPVELMGTWPDKPGIYVDSVPNLDRYFTASVELVGSIRHVLSSLVEVLNRLRFTPKWELAEIAAMRRHLDEIIPAATRPGARSQGMYPKELFRALNKVLPRDSIVSCDVGAHKFATGQLWRPGVPGSFLITNGLSSMGYGLPSAIAAKLIFPDRTAVAVLGDGGLAMYAGEMDTARRLGTPVIIVVCVDNALSLIKMNQARKGYPPYGSEFTNPDWTLVAAGMGLGAASAETEQGMEDALQEALKSGKPYLIRAMVDPKGYEVAE